MKNPLRAVSKDESLSFRFTLPVVAENVLTIFIGLLFSRIISSISASALAAIGMSKHAAGAWAKDNIRVNTICPGLTETPITDAGDGKVKDKEAHEKAIPLGRIAQPSDMANAALFLASSESGYMTGTTRHVNGGKYMYGS